MADFNKRESVVPSTSYRWRSRSVMSDEDSPKLRQSSLDNNNNRFLPNAAFRTASAATNHLKRVGKMFSIDKTREVLRTALEDSEKILYIKLACEHEELTKELKRMRGFVSELCERYEAARSLDPIRRYKKMQSMAKTIVLQLRVNDPNSNIGAIAGSCYHPIGEQGCTDSSLIVGDVLQSSVKQKEMRLKHEKCANGLGSEQMHRDIARLRSDIDDLRLRIESLSESINQIDSIYNTIKTEPFMKRYAILKEAIKDVQKFRDPNYDLP